MYQGETITTTISGFPVPVSEIANLYIIFRSSAKILIEKTFADCTVDGETVSFKLSQQESLNLWCGPITRSVIVITKDGSRFESEPSQIVCGQTAKREVLT